MLKETEMSSKMLKSLIEKSSLVEFEMEFKEAVSNEIQNIIEKMREDIKAQFILQEAADIIGSAKEDDEKDKPEKESPKADDDSKGPSDEPDADDTEADKKEKVTEVSK